MAGHDLSGDAAAEDLADHLLSRHRDAPKHPYTHERDDRDAEPEVAAARRIRDDLIQISMAHEQRVHGGQPCARFRCNTIAYLAHCIGIRRPNLLVVAALLDSYGHSHEEQHDEGSSET